jgi:5-formyltetrahydrofolate cyclo-ligase
MEEWSGCSKAEVRGEALRRRAALSPAQRGESERAILTHMREAEEFQTARSVMAYWGFGSEIDTRPLLGTILDEGKRLVMPKVNRISGELDLYEVKDLERDLMPGVWGIREPDPERCGPWQPADLQLVMVPGVAFDYHGGRIGYGKGFYDQLLANCAARKLAAAFECQVFERVPMDEKDVRMDKLITELSAVTFS